MHGILKKSTEFLAEIRGAEAKICDVEAKYLARKQSTRFLAEVRGAMTSAGGF
jgi:hypothetical protein